MKDLKLNDNKISKLPYELIKNRMLEMLDLGKNQFKSIEEIKIISELFRLKDLSLRNNPIIINKKEITFE